MNASVYAKPVMPRIVLRPALATVLLHALLIYLLTLNISFGEPDVVRVKPAPKVINATLVDVSQIRKPEPVKKPPPKKPVAKKPVPKPPPVKKAVPKKPAPKKVEQPKTEVKKAEPRAEVAKPEPRVTAAELAALAQAELNDAIAAEQSATAEQMTASYAALIQQTVIGYWSRPPSARNGMETLLQVQLVPTGEVVSVTVLRGSGNSAFDASAVNAVKKAGAFPELQNLPNAEFERTFRRFRLLFKPEDLRY